jgi:hypothetical protein
MVLFACSASTPSNATSSTRSILFSLSKAAIKKAYMLSSKAYYHTKLFFHIFLLPFSNLFGGVMVRLGICAFVQYGTYVQDGAHKLVL